MADTAPGKKNSIESPCENYNGQKGPSASDLGAPTKVYPGSEKLGRSEQKPGATIDSPAPQHGYTKK